jgi:hypothetical protein
LRFIELLCLFHFEAKIIVNLPVKGNIHNDNGDNGNEGEHNNAQRPVPNNGEENLLHLPAKEKLSGPNLC